MEFNISSAELLKGMMDVSKAIPAKSPLPILENFLFQVENGALTITASDQELTLRTRISIEGGIRQEGSIAVPAHQLMDLVKTIPDQPICIKTTSESSFDCIWTSGNSSLPFFPSEDYPEISGASQNALTASFPAQILMDAIAGTIYATADDEMRPTMNGIFFDLGEESSTLVASDSHKLICYTAKELATPFAASFILHKKPAGVLRSIIGKDVESVEATFDENTLIFKFDRTMMVCRLVVGKYPKYREVIPQNNSNILGIDREQLLSAVKRVSVCANKASNHIKFELKGGQLEITAQDLGFAIAAYEKLDVDYNGEALSIGFKSSFLIDILSNMECETIVMKFADARRAVLIVPSEEEIESERICGILMPIMVS